MSIATSSRSAGGPLPLPDARTAGLLVLIAAGACSQPWFILHGITFRYVDSMDEVLAIALLPADAAPAAEPLAEGKTPPPSPREIPVAAPGRRRSPAAPRA